MSSASVVDLHIPFVHVSFRHGQSAVQLAPPGNLAVQTPTMVPLVSQ